MYLIILTFCQSDVPKHVKGDWGDGMKMHLGKNQTTIEGGKKRNWAQKKYQLRQFSHIYASWNRTIQSSKTTRFNQSKCTIKRT